MTVRTKQQIPAVIERLNKENLHVNNEIAQLDQQVRTFIDDADLSQGVDNHIGDEADNIFEKERWFTIRAELVDRRTQIERALQKVDEGTYGTCENCGRPIAPERLEALPFAWLCITCQERADGEG